MSEQQPPAPTDGGNGTPPPAPPAPVGAATPFTPTKEEWVESRKEQRQIRDLLSKLVPGSAPPPASAPVAAPAAQSAPGPDLAAQVEDMRMDLAIERALRAAKVADNDPLAETLTDLVKAKRPPDVAAFVAQRAGALRGVAVTVTVPPTPPAAPSNTGPPAATPGAAGTIPDNPLDWGPDITKSMTPQDHREAYEKYLNKSGRGNPFAEHRARAETARKR